ncbi:MAG: DUF3325 domain-containing protein [Novosphingobium pentaromativorans]|uniref:DUF3325 domain-containing protein n=1 Tax=Novosphingobium pentaromativorans TaxID=205844 RepID=A0A2W5NWJ8_9SPHN|nr:DUF3325 domain-containing protein [Novosphingobium panipatense]PZQ56708.1 MAG: DUF3325 domain-containing protein [Novosphingobium pentaromativorans]
MIHLAIAVPALLGFASLLLAMVRHQQDWLRRKLSPPRSKALRRSGFAALALAFAVAGLGLGWAYGTVVWCGWLSAAAALVLTAQTNRERILRLLS